MNKPYLIAAVLYLVGFQALAQELIIPNNLRFLALGDSYTIGQGVEPSERWPNQLVSELKSMGYSIDELKIIAQTGWTTGSLINALGLEQPSSDYNLVSLLIGVNNQFQRRSEEEYAVEFTELIEKALAYANSDSSRVFVIAIPDYGATPYGQNFSNVSTQIDKFNLINREITDAYNLMYIDIVNISRRARIDPSLVASDGLHPSGKMYKEWVNEIFAFADVENITSLGTQEANSSVASIYPNPVVNQLHFTTVVSDIEISDSQGRVVYFNSSLESANFDASFLKNGSYLLRMTSMGQMSYTRFLKQ